MEVCVTEVCVTKDGEMQPAGVDMFHRRSELQDCGA